MKICPTCKATYKDEEQNFCLADGATLVKKRTGGKGVKETRAAGHSRANEVLAVGVLAFSVLVFLCLVSYNAADPTFNTVSSQKVQNWIGPVGANFAELLFSAAGVIAYLFPALLALLAWRFFQWESLRPCVSRIFGFTVFVASASGLVGLAGWRAGLIGAAVARVSAHLLSTLGATILLVALFTTAVLL